MVLKQLLFYLGTGILKFCHTIAIILLRYGNPQILLYLGIAEFRKK